MVRVVGRKRPLIETMLALLALQSTPETRAFAELLIDIEEDRYARALVVAMLRNAERGREGVVGNANTVLISR